MAEFEAQRLPKCVCGDAVSHEITAGGQHVGYYCPDCTAHEVQRLNGVAFGGGPLMPHQRVPAGLPESIPPWKRLKPRETSVKASDVVTYYSCALKSARTPEAQLAAVDKLMRSYSGFDEPTWREFLADDDELDGEQEVR